MNYRRLIAIASLIAGLSGVSRADAPADTLSARDLRCRAAMTRKAAANDLCLASCLTRGERSPTFDAAACEARCEEKLARGLDRIAVAPACAQRGIRPSIPARKKGPS
jgi:hypothetical protein